MKSFSQAGQDIFIRKVLDKKKNGYFLEIGTNHPSIINNTYILEKIYDWKGILVEYDDKWKNSYLEERDKSIPIIQDARKVDYLSILSENNFPNDMDYLQIDLEVSNKSTLETLQKLNETVFDTYKFRIVTFEHDIYSGDYYETRKISREIFENRGYILLFGDVKNGNNPFEDWYVHPELVNMEYINSIKTSESLEWMDIIKRL